MTIQPPSATEFLNMPSDPDEEAEETEAWKTDGGPLASIAWSLSDISALLEGFVRGPAKHEQAVSDARAVADTWREAHDDLEAKYESLFGLLADVEKLVSKSTSKLALGVRDAITAWKTGAPEVPSEVPVEVVAELTPEVAAVVEEVAAANEAAEGSGDDDHNHAWARTVDGVLVCECGAWIDERDAAYPQGIVREPNDG